MYYTCPKYCMVENIGEFRYLDYLEEKVLANSLVMDIKVSLYLREKTLVICQQIAKFANVLCCQCFLL